jgi:hypothetical protein
MTAEEFVEVIKLQTSDAAVRSTLASLKEPPGRVPKNRQLGLSRWFKGLSEADQRMVGEALREAAEAAVFGFFAVLDGARVFEYEEEKGDLELFHVRGAERTLLNPKTGPELHDIYNGLCQSQRRHTK